MLTATDGSPDTFRIKIWDQNAGDAVVYDNKLGIPDDPYEGTALGGGNVQVHKSVAQPANGCSDGVGRSLGPLTLFFQSPTLGQPSRRSLSGVFDIRAYFW